MINTLTIIHSIISVLLILIVLIHFGKGAESGLVLDAGSSSILPQKGNVLNKITGVLALLFLSLSLSLAVMRSYSGDKSVFDKAETKSSETTTKKSTSPSLPSSTKPSKK